MKRFLLLLLLSFLCGVFISPYLSKAIGYDKLMDAIPWFAVFPIAAISIIIILWGRLNDSSGVDGIKIRESEKLNKIIKLKVRPLLYSIAACFLCAVLFSTSRMLFGAAKNQPIADYSLPLYFAAFFFVIFIFISTLLEFKELTNFNLDIKQIIKEDKDRKDFLDKLENEGEEGFPPDKKLDSYNKFHNHA